MPDKIKLNIHNVKRAFAAEAGKLRNGEHSRFLPGFTMLEEVNETPREMPEEWNTYYVATRLRDGKIYGYKYRNSHYKMWGPFYADVLNVDATIEFVEMVEKTYTVTYFVPVT